MYDAGTPKPVFPVLYKNLEGWDWERGGRGVQTGRDKCIPVANS